MSEMSTPFYVFIDEFDASQFSASEAVRLLLSKSLAEQILFATDTVIQQSLQLNESNYPKKLLPLNWIVSFSHSQNGVACAIAQSGKIGVDIETRPISEQVAKRFFSPLEKQALLHLNATQAATLRQRLWVMKEAYIKAITGRLMLDVGTCMILVFGENSVDLAVCEWQVNGWWVKCAPNSLWCVVYESNVLY